MSDRPTFIVRASAVQEEELHYPAPFDAEKLSFGRNLGLAAGTVKLGAWQERLLPGRRSSFTHAHSAEEEFIYVLSGACSVRVVAPGKPAEEIPVKAGDAIAFPSGTGIAHCMVNRSEGECLLLCVGERRPENDRCVYPEDTAYDAHLRLERPERHWTDAADGPVKGRD